MSSLKCTECSEVERLKMCDSLTCSKEEREENFPLKGELSNSVTASAVILGGRVPFTCLAKFEKKK